MAPEVGIEPTITESKSGVLPLHYSGTYDLGNTNRAFDIGVSQNHLPRLSNLSRNKNWCRLLKI
jgi:hypothetical protein